MTIQNSICKCFYRNCRNSRGSHHQLLRIPPSYFHLSQKSCISWWTSMRHFQLLSKCEGKQLENMRITTRIRKSNKNKNELFSPATGKDINFTDMFFFTAAEGWGEKRNLYRAGGWRSKRRSGEGWNNEHSSNHFPPSPRTVYPNPRSENKRSWASES